LPDTMLQEMVALVPKLRAYAIVLTKSVSDADDLVQDTLLRAWKFREGFRAGTNLKAWLFRILRNEFLDTVQAAGPSLLNLDERLIGQLACPPEQEFSVRYGELLRGVDQLSGDTREALLLTAGAGFTYEEAAEVCGCPVGTIKSRVNRAREFLMRSLDFEAPSRAKVASCH